MCIYVHICNTYTYTHTVKKELFYQFMQASYTKQVTVLALKNSPTFSATPSCNVASPKCLVWPLEMGKKVKQLSTLPTVS